MQGSVMMKGILALLRKLDGLRYVCPPSPTLLRHRPGSPLAEPTDYTLLGIRGWGLGAGVGTGEQGLGTKDRRGTRTRDENQGRGPGTRTRDEDQGRGRGLSNPPS